MPVADVVAFFTSPGAAHRHKAYPVISDDKKLSGMVTKADVLEWVVKGWPPEATLAGVLA